MRGPLTFPETDISVGEMICLEHAAKVACSGLQLYLDALVGRLRCGSMSLG